MALVQTPTSLNDLKPRFSVITAEDRLGLPKRKLRKKFPEPNYQAIDECLELVEELALVLGEMEEELSDEDRKSLKDLSIQLFEHVKRIDRGIVIINSLPESVPWKQKADDKLVHLANRIEDVAEVYELALDDEFIKMIKDRLQDFLDASSEN